MGVLNLCMKDNPLSRAWHGTLLVPCLVLAMMAAISLGTFVPLHLDIKDYEPGSGSGAPVGELKRCILFASADRDNEQVDYQDNTACDFMIWGQVAVGSLAIALGGVFIAKICLGVRVFSWTALIELFLCTVGFIFTIALGVVITVGLDDTCNAHNLINDRNPYTDYMPCNDFRFAIRSSITFYDQLNTSKVVTWIEAALLFILLVWYVLLSLLKFAMCIARMGKTKKDKPTKVYTKV